MISKERLLEISKEPNVSAFLKAIRLGEGTTKESGYMTIVGGGKFTDFKWHPKIRVWIPRYKLYSTAAGAYQIISPTWQALASKYKFPDFSPEWQDAAAVALIIEKGALDEIRKGELAKAVGLCSPVWASLPGSKAGQRQETFLAVQQVYKANGGTMV